VLGGFAALSLVLAILGVYAVMSHVVSDRTREIGIRNALGAPRSGIVRMVVGDGARLAAIGLLLGGIGLAAGSRLMRGLLFGVRPFDVPSLAAGIGLLGIATIVACYLPTWRALRVEPTIALKGE
jgi:ABC-type antimicrobial peptide transport system permease subunit